MSGAPTPTPDGEQPELIDSRVLHVGRVFRVLAQRVRLASGLLQELDIVDHPGAVAVAALDDSGRLVLVRQYRHAVGAHTLEVPAGRLDPGEEPQAAARRELEEETGLRAGRWEFLRTFLPAPGFCSERIHLFLAGELFEAAGDRLAGDEDEEIEVVRLLPAEAAGISQDGKTLLAIACLLGGPLPRRIEREPGSSNSARAPSDSRS